MRVFLKLVFLYSIIIFIVPSSESFPVRGCAPQRRKSLRNKPPMKTSRPNTYDEEDNMDLSSYKVGLYSFSLHTISFSLFHTSEATNILCRISKAVD